MDSQTQPSVVSSSLPSSHAHKRRTFLTIIILAAVIASGWLLYQHSKNKQLTEADKAVILQQISAASDAAPQPTEAQKAAMLAAIEKANAPAAPSSTTLTKSNSKILTTPTKNFYDPRTAGTLKAISQ